MYFSLNRTLNFQLDWINHWIRHNEQYFRTVQFEQKNKVSIDFNTFFKIKFFGFNFIYGFALRANLVDIFIVQFIYFFILRVSFTINAALNSNINIFVLIFHVFNEKNFKNFFIIKAHKNQEPKKKKFIEKWNNPFECFVKCQKLRSNKIYFMRLWWSITFIEMSCESKITKYKTKQWTK